MIRRTGGGCATRSARKKLLRWFRGGGSTACARALGIKTGFSCRFLRPSRNCRLRGHGDDTVDTQTQRRPETTRLNVHLHLYKYFNMVLTTSLHIAAYDGDVTAIEQWLNAGGDPNERAETSGESLLHLIADYGLRSDEVERGRCDIGACADRGPTSTSTISAPPGRSARRRSGWFSATACAMRCCQSLRW